MLDLIYYYIINAFLRGILINAFCLSDCLLYLESITFAIVHISNMMFWYCFLISPYSISIFLHLYLLLLLYFLKNKSNYSIKASPLPSPVRSPARTPTDTRGPCCQALYDFDAENENELNFKEGDIIQLVTKVDDNWYEGSINGRTGLFPVSYVQVLVPI